MSNKVKVILLCLFLLGAGIRAVDVWRPVDGSVRASWRECDIASVARNYYREGMNLLYPRIDWRGDGPGYAEMEFPLYPWSIALLYKVFGFHEVLGRLLSYLFSLITMGIFFKLALYLLPELGAIAASIFFVLSPLAVRISNSLQPEGLMFLCYVLAAYAFIRWIHENSWKYYGVALGATALAILAKANAAHIGFFFAAVLLTQKGFGVLRKARVWIFAIASLLPAVLWYSHAHNFWLIYGNSLGVSNEYHWVGLDLFTNPEFILGIGRLELLYVWMPTGILIVGIGFFFRTTHNEVKYSLYWLSAIFLYYLIAARTTGDSWAVYYHVVSVPPVALLIGSGVAAIYHFTIYPRNRRVFVIAYGSLIAALGVFGFRNNSKLLILSALLGFSILSMTLLDSDRLGSWRENPKAARSQLFNKGLIFFVTLGLLGTFVIQARQVKRDFRPNGLGPKYECAMSLVSEIPENELIVASGYACRDDSGYPVAYNASYFFYWLDRKGFNICREEQSVEVLRSLAKRGAGYFVAEKSEVSKRKGFASQLRKEFSLIKECHGVYLFDLIGKKEVAIYHLDRDDYLTNMKTQSRLGNSLS